MVLTDCRDQLECYGIDTALKYLDGKLSENAVKRLLGENTMFNEVSHVSQVQSNVLQLTTSEVMSDGNFTMQDLDADQLV